MIIYSNSEDRSVEKFLAFNRLSGAMDRDRDFRALFRKSSKTEMMNKSGSYGRSITR